MNIKDITYFVEVAKEKNFTRAAKNLHIYQPALSKAIKILEYDMNTKLIERNTKTFKLTDEGEEFYENAKKSLETINLEIYKLKDSLISSKKTLILGLPPVIGTVYFTSIVAKFKEKYPDINVNIVEEGSNNIKHRVEDGSIELGAVILPVEGENLITIPITYGDVMLVVSKDHDLSKKKYIDVKELEYENFITFNENFMMYDKTITACKESGFEPNIIIKTTQWDFIVEMVALNQGITIMPKPIVERFKKNDIKIIPIKSPIISWDVGFILKKDRYVSNSLKVFIKFVLQSLEKSN